MAFLLYLAQVSLYATVMWGIYLLAWRNRPLHLHSRIYLLSSILIPVLLPFIHLPMSGKSAMAGYVITLPEISAGIRETTAGAASYPSAGLLLGVYFIGSLFMLLAYVRSHMRIHARLNKGVRKAIGGRQVFTGTSIGPGTLGRRIFFPSDEVDPVILRHELAHIQAGHRFDSDLLQLMHIVFWISPAHWWLGRELKTVHEFEADRIASQGINPTHYASLLLSQSLGTTQSIAVANSFFHHPLKRRIMMLQQMKAPSRSSLIFTSVGLTAAFMGTVLLANPGSHSKARIVEANAPAVVDMDIVRRNTPPPRGEIRQFNDGTIAFKTVEKVPAFDGDLAAWFKANLVYPEAAKAKGITGSCLIEFTIDEYGNIRRPQIGHSSGNEMLDNEALRAVNKMPKWKPGLQYGVPVPVFFRLPVNFGVHGGC